MRAGYKVIYLTFKNDKILVVANLPSENDVYIFSRLDEKDAKRLKNNLDIGFWRIKRKETINAK